MVETARMSMQTYYKCIIKITECLHFLSQQKIENIDKLPSMAEKETRSDLLEWLNKVVQINT